MATSINVLNANLDCIEMIETKLSFVCPQCLAVNRVPEARVGEGPICGKCKVPLIPPHPIELDGRGFQKFISRTDVLVVVDFWAPWCGPCQSMAPEFAKAFRELAPNTMLAKLNTQIEKSAAAPFGIQGIPCLIAFRNGKEVARQAGMMDSAQIVQWVRTIR